MRVSALLLTGIIAASITACGLSVTKIPAGMIIPRTDHDHFQKIGDVNLHYREYPGSGPAVFMQHGFGSSTYSWEKIAPALNARGFHLWALDLKGSGWSDKPAAGDYSPITLMEEVNAFMETKGIRDAVFIGNSLGGAIAVMLAIDHPDKVKKLILLDAAGYPMKKPSTVKMAALHGSSGFGNIIFGKWMVKDNLNQIFYDKKLISGEAIDAYYDRLRTDNGLKAMELLARALDFSIFDKYQERIPKIDKETLIIWGRDDRWIPVSLGFRYRKDIAKSRIVVIPECGHAPQEEAPELTSRYILDFLEGREITESPDPGETKK